MPRAAVTLAAVFGAAGCIFAAGSLDDYSNGTRPDGGDADAAADVTTVEADGAITDAGTDVDLDACVDCIAPTGTFDPKPPDAGSSPCRADGVLTLDGQGAGLDRFGGVSIYYIDGRDESSCVGVEFSADIRAITVVMRGSANGCGNACTSCEPAVAEVFAGPSATSLNPIGDRTTLGAQFSGYSFDVGIGTRAVVVCRTGAANGSSDVEVDAIIGHKG